ncbi:MAG: ABC transporter permease [Kutzneria sp.]|nr:ABC transporter permease [Kutzneria sp.]
MPGRLPRVLRGKLLPPAMAIVFSALLCTVALLISAGSPGTALAAMVSQVGKGTTAVDILNSATIYYLIGVAVAIGFKMNLFNIGVEGQYRIGAVTGAIVGGATNLPPVLEPLLVILSAVAAGALYAALPAILKVTRGVSEVITTIMLNAVSIGILALLINEKTFGVLVNNNIATKPIPQSGWIPGVSFGSHGTLFGFVVVAIAVGIAYWVMLNRSRFGFELRASGESPTAAMAGGVNAKRMIVVAMLLSGATAGLTALPELLGRDHVYTQLSPQGYGFTGIAVALLGRNNPGGIAFGALLWAFLDQSAVSLDNVGVPKEIVTIMQGAIVLSVVVSYEVIRRFELAAEQRRVGAQLGTATVAAAGGAS